MQRREAFACGVDPARDHAEKSGCHDPRDRIATAADFRWYQDLSRSPELPLPIEDGAAGLPLR